MAEPIFDASLETLLAEFSKSGVRELHLRIGDFELYLSNDETAPGWRPTSPMPGIAPLPPPTPARAAPAARFDQTAVSDWPGDAEIVRAPNLGTFYRAPKPGAANYVEIGSIISVGEELCLIEVMKLFTAVRAETAGRIHAVLAPDGEMVEAGQPLFAIMRI